MRLDSSEAVQNGTVESADSYRKERLSADDMLTAKDRAQHVIVVMLENRSFDHMLGLLDHPRRDLYAEYFVDICGHPNPWTVNRAKGADATVAVAGGLSPALEMDPPHGHASALAQLGRDGNRFKMDGFVDAYAAKLAGREPHPRIRKRRAVPAALALAAAAGIGVSEIWTRSTNGSGVRDAGILLTGALVAYSAAGSLMFPGTSRLHRALAAGGATVLAISPLAVLDWDAGRLRWAVGGAAVAALCGLGFLGWKKVSTARVESGEAPRIMDCLLPESLPVLATLARRYALCVRWHSSVPGATWPNRHFAHAGTSDESVDIEVGFYQDPTIFDRLESRGADWRIYHAGIPQVIAFSELWSTPSRRRRWRSHEQLIADIDAGTLPEYAFVEPAHSGDGSNSQHPGNNEGSSADFYRAEAFIADIYRHLLASGSGDLFKKTVLAITYDEHGGLFDHVPPPAAVAPEPLGQRRRARTLARRAVSWFVPIKTQPFTFDHLGVRVPTVIISPWVKPNEIDTTVYDHSSIPATLSRLFLEPDGAADLGDRVEVANDFAHLLLGSDEADLTPANIPAADDPTYPPPEFGTSPGDDDDPAQPSVVLADDLDAQLKVLERKVSEAFQVAATARPLEASGIWAAWNSDVITKPAD